MSARIGVLENMPELAPPSPTLGELLHFVASRRRRRNGSVPFVLSFSNLTYSVNVPRRFGIPAVFGGGRKTAGGVPAAAVETVDGGEYVFSRSKVLLNDISGQAMDGEILAVLGASGSGKSTLIDALANRIAKGSLNGKVTWNRDCEGDFGLCDAGRPVVSDANGGRNFDVRGGLPSAADFVEVEEEVRVQALIDQLGLRQAAKTVIGTKDIEGLRWRTPPCLDWNGYHSRSDHTVSGRTDIRSRFHERVHGGEGIATDREKWKHRDNVRTPAELPASRFARPAFVSVRGQTVYSGSPANLLSFFSDFGHPIPDKENRTEFALDLIRELEGSPGGTKSLVEFNKSWQNLKRSRSDIRECFSRKISFGATNDLNPTSIVRTFANPMWMEMAVLSKRSFKNSWRMPELFATRRGRVTGFILATTFGSSITRREASENGLDSCFRHVHDVLHMCRRLPVFLQERYIFMRETAYNAYRRSSYVLSHSLVAIPSLIFLSLAFAVITFWASDSMAELQLLRDVPLLRRPHTFMLGYVIVVAILAYFLLFSGFFINRDRIPVYWIWFHYISLIKYPFEAVLHNEFQDPIKCFVRAIPDLRRQPSRAGGRRPKLELLKSMSQTWG
ncbi:LOW QUALITY PROTEIN: hypothetical protein OSB04_026467 [Centaurea solstitialis]|uniref:ABC transporter domain-containing protein n=1 Tax=Centaurea solstitialis TaxID=347529 RepID=A0AA38W9B6_9ASTR|nr:LOW QUALITY PROTEIN: hypothetical protein OSB04_026467 [Centaurea solstitialis]